MEEKLRFAIGIMGNAASLLLYASPMLTFSRVIRNKSTGDFSCTPYILALMNCLLYTWYGLPVVSCKWENFSLVTTNGLGILSEISFILIYLYFASPSGKKKVASLTTCVLLVSCLVAVLSAFVVHDHRHRKALVGSVGVVASVSMYASPLVAVKQVMQTRSVEFMPFYLSFFSFLSSSLWTAYGLLSHDIFIASPSLVGSLLAILQLSVYCMYRNRGTIKEPQKWDIGRNCVKPTQHLKANEEKYEKAVQPLEVKEERDDEKANLQLVVTDATNEKM